MNKSMEQIRLYAGLLDSRSLRERFIILLALLLLLIVVWNQFLFEPSARVRKAALNEIAQARIEIKLLRAEEGLVIQRAKTDPDLAVHRQIKQLDQSIADLDRQLETKLVDLISPGEMPMLLQQLLKQQKGLKLVGMENLQPEPLMTPGDENKETPMGIYRHALEMELEGSYIRLLKYLQKLEKMDQRLFWDILTLDAHGFPTTRIRLRIHTLSLAEDWIGV